MGAFTDLDDFVNRMTGGNSGAPENLPFSKHMSAGGTAVGFGFAQALFSTWRFDGIPGAGSVAAAVAACDKTTVGALQFTNSAGSAVKRIVQAVAASGNNSVDVSPLFVMDRLLAKGGLSGTSTSAQTVAGSIGRYTGGVGNQIWIEIQTAIGSATTTVTASYTNEAGTAGRTTIARRIGGSPYNVLHSAHQLPLQAGDLGVRSVQSVTLAASTTTAGDFAVVIYHPLTFLVGRGTPQGPFGQLGGLPEMVDDACITFLVHQGQAGVELAGMLCAVDV